MNPATKCAAMSAAQWSIPALLLVGAAIFLSACGGSGSTPIQIEDPQAQGVSTPVSSGASSSLSALIYSLPMQDLSDAEVDAIRFMREEEKLARDVYAVMHETWGMQIFDNIAGSEQTHMDAVLLLIEKYGLADPAENSARGEFSDPALQGLYDSLVAQGVASELDALIVGATIEDLDIYDLHQQLAVTDNEDVTVVFDNLQKGSRNHLRAFHARLVDGQFTYIPSYITQSEYDEIVNSPMERG